MKKFLITLVCTGTICAFNPKSSKHIYARRLLGERKISKEQFFEALREINKADCNQQITDYIAQKHVRTAIEKS